MPSATLGTRDGKYVIIGGNGDSVYSRLMAAVGVQLHGAQGCCRLYAVQWPRHDACSPASAGRPDMDSSNPAYANNAKRCEREAEIYQVTDPALRQRKQRAM